MFAFLKDFVVLGHKILHLHTMSAKNVTPFIDKSLLKVLLYWSNN